VGIEIGPTTIGILDRLATAEIAQKEYRGRYTSRLAAFETLPLEAHSEVAVR
jgi:hypothetical protein